MVNPDHFIREPAPNYPAFPQGRGLKNWKNLFKKPNLLELTILIMLILALFMFWAYYQDISACREAINILDTNACEVCSNKLKQETTDINPGLWINESFIFNEGTDKD